MLHLVKHVERWFWAFCIGAVLIGLFVEATAPLGNPWVIRIFLGGILFFTGLKMDFKLALRELARPWVVLYAVGMIMVVLPLVVGLMAKSLMPASFALGILIVAAVPSGLAGTSLTDIAKGNTALAIVITLATSLVCPVVTPLVIKLGAGVEIGANQAGQSGLHVLLKQTGFLAAVLFVPLVAAYLVRRFRPAMIERHREGLTGLSIVSLCLLIVGAMASCSEDFKKLLHESPWQVVELLGFMCLFSTFRHLAGYFMAPWRPVADRAAISINSAYVNNGLAIAFATSFFKPTYGAAAVLPAIFLEIPMILAILPLRAWVAHATGRGGGGQADQPGSSADSAAPFGG